ncbi:MAG: phage major capsid protein [Planctomycetota bacterium]
MTAKELREKRAKLVPQIRALADRQAEWTAEDRQNWEQLNQDYDRLSAEVAAAEEVEQVRGRAQQLEAEQRAPAGDERIGRHDPQRSMPRDDAGAVTEEHRNLALQAWCLRQSGHPLRQLHVDAARRVGLNPNRRSIDIAILPTAGMRDLQRRYREHRDDVNVNTTVATGGYTIPEGFVNSLEVSMLAFGGPRQVATILRTSGGGDLPWPTATDTANKGALLTEETTVGDSVAPTFGQIEFKAYKFSSKLVKVSAEILQDSAFDLANELGRMLGERLGRIEADYFTTGTGNDQPQGITAAAAGKTTASATAVTADELMDMVHSVDPAYRGMPGVGWMMHDSILLAIRKLKDGEGRYIWQSGMQSAEPDRLLNYPITINQSMASTLAATNKVAVFGALRKFVIRDAGTIRLRRLVERYADTDQEGFVAFTRSDSRILDAGTDPIKTLQMHA